MTPHAHIWIGLFYSEYEKITKREVLWQQMEDAAKNSEWYKEQLGTGEQNGTFYVIWCGNGFRTVSNKNRIFFPLLFILSVSCSDGEDTFNNHMDFDRGEVIRLYFT